MRKAILLFLIFFGIFFVFFTVFAQVFDLVGEIYADQIDYFYEHNTYFSVDKSHFLDTDYQVFEILKPDGSRGFFIRLTTPGKVESIGFEADSQLNTWSIDTKWANTTSTQQQF